MIQPSAPSLRDIHLPPEPAWWPPAPGWWALVVLSLLLTGVATWFVRRQRRMSRQRRRVLDELDRIAVQYEHDGDTAQLVTGLHQLLRRVARRHDAQATRQRGEAWRRTLARVPLDAPALEQLLALDQWLYRPPTDFDHAGAIAAVRSWLRVALKPKRWKPLAAEPVDA
ncbi:DUF4381 domain-containing protein [Rhodanobacter ginsengiterrae]|uniref:DUF4381 domain-containing protein n=1 Tax=Rhodanobacter ginsengiterrae TaxID=2008451 RepID=UPI003CED9EBA